jgi:hypothetical protein
VQYRELFNHSQIFEHRFTSFLHHSNKASLPASHQGQAGWFITIEQGMYQENLRP